MFLLVLNKIRKMIFCKLFFNTLLIISIILFLNIVSCGNIDTLSQLHSFVDASELREFSQVLFISRDCLLESIVTEGTQDRFLVNLSKNESYYSNKQYTNVVNRLHRFPTVAFIDPTAACLISMVQISKFYKYLSRLKGVFKSNRDYLVFCSISKTSGVFQDLLINDPTASTVRNKLLIIVSSAIDVQLKSVQCLHCGRGKATLFDLSPLVNKSSSNDGSYLRLTSLFPNLISDFYGRRIVISCPMLIRSAFELRQVSPGQWVSIRGIMHSTLHHIMGKLNFTGTFVPSSGGGSTGRKYPNGTWIGTVGDVLNEEAELGMGVAHTLSRSIVVDFSEPMIYIWLTFTTGQPLPSYSWTSIYRPFTIVVWAFISVNVGISILFLKSLLNRILRKSASNSELVMYCLRIFLEQDITDDFSDNHTSRVFIAFWLLYALVISASYRSKLVSSLMFPMVEKPPTTFKELAEEPLSHQIALQYVRGAGYQLFKTSTNPVFQKIFKRMELEEDEVACFQKVLAQPHFTCISWNAMIDYVLYKNISDKYGNAALIRATETSSFTPVSLIFRKGNVYQNEFNWILAWSKDMGLSEIWKMFDNHFVHRERKEWELMITNSSTTPKDDDERKVNKVNLKMENLVGTFYILNGGFLLALIGFIWEFASSHLKINNQNN